MIRSACCLLQVEGADEWCKHLMPAKLEKLKHLQSGVRYGLPQVCASAPPSVADIVTRSLLCSDKVVTDRSCSLVGVQSRKFCEKQNSGEL